MSANLQTFLLIPQLGRWWGVVFVLLLAHLGVVYFVKDPLGPKSSETPVSMRSRWLIPSVEVLSANSDDVWRQSSRDLAMDGPRDRIASELVSTRLMNSDQTLMEWQVGPEWLASRFELVGVVSVTNALGLWEGGDRQHWHSVVAISRASPSRLGTTQVVVQGDLARRRIESQPNWPASVGVDPVRPSVYEVTVGADGAVFTLMLLNGCGNSTLDAQGIPLVRQMRWMRDAEDTENEKSTLGIVKIHWQPALAIPNSPNH